MRRGDLSWFVGGVSLGVALLVASGCGRTALKIDVFDAGPDVLTAEACDGLDNDLDSRVDEGFRDELGRYVNDGHCGQCNQACTEPLANATAVTCGLVFESPACIPTECSAGFGPTFSGTCAPLNAHLCLPCLQDNECGDLIARACSAIAGEQRCTLSCVDDECPAGYRCDLESMRCLPDGGSCSCEPGESFALACILTDEGGGQCTGTARCDNGVFTECTVEEICDEQDNDCDGEVDETFRNARGAYAIDVHNCGMCGVDCDASERPGVELTCGGDPLSPSCVLDCPDLRDGLMPGDKVDGDRVIGNGCECTFTSSNDVPGPVLAEGETLDVNCDGADGDVLNSYYVAPDGDDRGPGSPTKPLRTIAFALDKAAESLTTRAPRRDIFIAAGNYVEELVIPDGVRIHGGYRRDFLALDPEGFRVVWIAPANTSAPGGAAAVIREGAGTQETVVEWVALRGLDATQPGAPAIGLWIEPSGPELSLREMVVRSGTPGDGADGVSGVAGRSPTTEATRGAVQRAAVEDSSRACIPAGFNVVSGGSGGRNTCDGVAVSGGNGGSPGCPAGAQPGGTSGTGSGSAFPGRGGPGGDDLQGPIPQGPSCPTTVCCGLADFSVPPSFRFPQAGENGGSGDNGNHGTGCTDPLGSFAMRSWRGGRATGGTTGRAGAGGGGGGGGGTAQIGWDDFLCRFSDGIGGGGGGGGAGGCGGTAGTPGSSGGPAIGIVIERGASPRLTNVTVESSRGGRGGDGGVGGEGALGGVGAFGGAVPREQQSTPTLAGAVPGARGGRGGNGGAGGGGGGGCGGGSIGVWLAGGAEPGLVENLRANNQFGLGDAGRGGRGGGGAVPAAAGADGGMFDVVSR